MVEIPVKMNPIQKICYERFGVLEKRYQKILTVPIYIDTIVQKTYVDKGEYVYKDGNIFIKSKKREDIMLYRTNNGFKNKFFEVKPNTDYDKFLYSPDMYNTTNIPDIDMDMIGERGMIFDNETRRKIRKSEITNYTRFSINDSEFFKERDEIIKQWVEQKESSGKINKKEMSIGADNKFLNTVKKYYTDDELILRLYYKDKDVEAYSMDYIEGEYQQGLESRTLGKAKYSADYMYGVLINESPVKYINHGGYGLVDEAKGMSKFGLFKTKFTKYISSFYHYFDTDMFPIADVKATDIRGWFD